MEDTMAGASSFEPSDPDYDRRVRDSFARQGLMGHLRALLSGLGPGWCEIELPFRPELTQQHGFFHAGSVITIADTAAGYAAYSLMPAGSSVLTAELKINLMAPARGERLLARGLVRKPGRTLSVVEAEVTAFDGERSTTVALMLATMFCLAGRPDQSG
jgi:uncharacterized protein (TIGR00369 family)